MSKMLVFLLVLASASHARRIQTAFQPESTDMLNEDKGKPIDSETDERLKALATNLFAANPAVLSKPIAGTGVSVPPTVQISTPAVKMSRPPVQMSTPIVNPAHDTSVSEPLVPEIEISEVPASDADPSVKPKKNRFWRLAAPSLAAVASARPAVAAAAAGVCQVGAASGFFTNVRVPATLLSGTALAALFVDIKEPEGRNMRMLKNMYLFFAVTTVALELSCVFMASTMNVRLLAGGFSSVAPNAVAFLRREFEFEYIAVRLSFFTGILSFLACIGTRIWLTFSKSQPFIAKALGFFLLSLAAFFDGFWRHTVVNYGGYFEMLRRCIYLFFVDFLPKQPFTCCLMVAFLAAATGSLALGFRDLKKADEAQGGDSS